MKTFIVKMARKFMTTNIFKLYGVMLLINLSWIFIIGGTLLVCGCSFSQNVASSSQFKNSLLLVPMAALFEEIIFRWLPMLITVAIVTAVVKRSKRAEELEAIKKRWMLIVLVVIAVVFGYVHGNIFNVFLQGVSALIISGFYFRAYFRSNPDKRITKTQLIPLASATLFHTMTNMIMIF